MSGLILERIGKTYDANGVAVHALEGVDLAVDPGEFVTLVGPSGCGKSTLLRIVAGLEAPTTGRVLLDGRAVAGWGPDRCLIFQRPNLFPWLTAADNVAFGLRMRGGARAERRCAALAALRTMDLEAVAGLYPHQLSGGMQQRVALARALVLDPAVLLMDEPLASLDALLRSRLQRELRAACRGKTVLFVTHDIREALVLADRVVVLSPRPGTVRAEVRPDAPAPRDTDARLLVLQREIEAELLCADGHSKELAE